MVRLNGEYVAEILILIVILILNHDASNLQQFFLELTDFIMLNVAFYDESGSSMSFTIKMHYVVQCVSRHTAIALVCKICFRYNYDIYVLTEDKILILSFECLISSLALLF